MEHLHLLSTFEDNEIEEFKNYALKHKHDITPIINSEIIDPTSDYRCFPLLTGIAGNAFDSIELIKFLFREFGEQIDPNCRNRRFATPPIAYAFRHGNFKCAIEIAKHPKFDLQYSSKWMATYGINTNPTIEMILAVAPVQRLHGPMLGPELAIKDYMNDPYETRKQLRMKFKFPCPELSANVFAFCLLLENKIFQI